MTGYMVISIALVIFIWDPWGWFKKSSKKRKRTKKRRKTRR